MNRLRQAGQFIAVIARSSVHVSAKVIGGFYKVLPLLLLVALVFNFYLLGQLKQAQLEAARRLSTITKLEKQQNEDLTEAFDAIDERNTGLSAPAIRAMINQALNEYGAGGSELALEPPTTYDSRPVQSLWEKRAQELEDTLRERELQELKDEQWRQDQQLKKQQRELDSLDGWP